MRIHCDYTTAFMATRTTKPKASIKQFIQNKDKFWKSDLYANIDNYLKNNISKKDFLKQFAQKGYPSNLSRNEQKQINDLKMSIDLTNNLDDISEEYIKEKIQKLLGSKKG